MHNYRLCTHHLEAYLRENSIHHGDTIKIAPEDCGPCLAEQPKLYRVSFPASVTVALIEAESLEQAENLAFARATKYLRPLLGGGKGPEWREEGPEWRIAEGVFLSIHAKEPPDVTEDDNPKGKGRKEV